MAEFMVKMMFYDETLNFIQFLILIFFLGVQGTVGGFPGGQEAADEQNMITKKTKIDFRFEFFFWGDQKAGPFWGGGMYIN